MNHIITEKHGEYDFGSYKRGYEYLLKNNVLCNFDELIFANDSCYAPLFDFKDMFDVMSNKSVDFWGNSANHNDKFDNIKHVQSYFIVFKPQVFNSDVFKNFIKSMKAETNKDDIIKKYECGLTDTLSKNHFHWDVYCKLSLKYQDAHFFFFQELIKLDKSPFVKRNITVINTKLGMLLWNFKSFIRKHTNYDYLLINNNYAPYTRWFISVMNYIIKKYLFRKYY